MSPVISRRSALLGIGTTLAMPAVVRAESLMHIVAPKLAYPEVSLVDLAFEAKMLALLTLHRELAIISRSNPRFVISWLDWDNCHARGWSVNVKDVIAADWPYRTIPVRA